MPEIIPPEPATVPPVVEPIAPPVDLPAESPKDEWESKYQGQLKVNRDLETKWKNEIAAREALELANKPAEEQAAAKARAEAEAEAKSKYDAKLVRANLLALATGKLANPSNAALFLDLKAFTVTDDGEVDSAALVAAIDELLTKEPHLAAKDSARFQGAGDGGAGAPPKPKESFDDAIAAAQAARNFPLVATLKQQKAAQKG